MSGEAAQLPSWSPVTLDIDLEAEGRRTGTITLPVAGMGSLQIPIVLVRNGEGPTVVMTGAVHGDEYEGPIALSNLARRVTAPQVRGRLIIVPFLNPSALSAARRESPLDGKDLNRSFPGRPDGTPSEVLAHWVAIRLVPIADAVIDCHTGGTWTNWIPLVMMHPQADAALHRRMLDLIRAMAPPLGVVLNETDKPGMFDTFVERSGKVFVCCEFGGGTLSQASLGVAEVCLRNALRHFGMHDGLPETCDWPFGPRLMTCPELEWAAQTPVGGLYEPLVELGTEVKAGSLLGRVHPLETLGGSPENVLAPVSGTLFFRPASSRVEPGQRVAMLARDL